MAQRMQQGNPVFILNEDSQRTQGRDAQSSNIAAGRAVAEAVRTTLGPKGMDKMLVGDTGDVVITNDGVTILEEMDIDHPAAQMLVEVAETQEEEVGDGTTTAAVLAGQLLSQAEDLLEQDVHPRTIVEGYAAARSIAVEAVAEAAIDDTDDGTLAQVAKSSMTGKGTGDVDASALADLVVDAIRFVRDGENVSRDDVHVYTQMGASSSATELVEGVVAEEEAMRDDMPRSVEGATVAVIDGLEPRETEVDVEYSLDSTAQLDAAVEAEGQEVTGYAQALVDAGVDVVFATGDVDERAAALLAKEGVLVFESLSSSDATRITRATGAAELKSLDDLDSEDFGSAESVRIETYDDDDLVFVEGGAATKAATLFVRGGTSHVTDELERAIGDALDVVAVAVGGEGVVPGAGATEIAISSRIRDEAASVEGRQQLAVEAFAEAVDMLPRTLAGNMGLDQIDTLVELRAANESSPGRAGIVARGETGEVADPLEDGVLDPAAVKREAVESATEAATMIVRIDDIISAE